MILRERIRRCRKAKLIRRFPNRRAPLTYMDYFTAPMVQVAYGLSADEMARVTRNRERDAFRVLRRKA